MQLESREILSHPGSEPLAGDPLSESVAKSIPKLDVSLTLWVILFVFGGGLLALYYAGIGYFPEVSWQDALTFMALMTIIGGSLLVAYSFLLLVPGVIWSEFLICDKQLHPLLMMGSRRWEPCVWAVTKRILFPFALFMAFCHFLLYEDGPWGLAPLGAIASLLAVTTLLLRNLQKGFLHFQPKPEAAAGREADPPSLNRHRLSVAASHVPFLGAFIAKAGSFGPDLTASSWGQALLWGFALLPLVSFIALYLHGRSELRKVRRARDHAFRDPDHVGLLCRAALAFASAALLSLMALCFFHRIYKEVPGDPVERVPWTLLLLCTLVVIVTNLIVSVLFHEHRRAAFFASFLAALLLLGAGQLLGTIPEIPLPAKIMGKFGFGAQAVRLVVTEWGGRLLCQQGVPVAFERPQPADPGASEAAGNSEKEAKGKPREVAFLARADHLTILSRLGAQVLLRFDDPDQLFQNGEVPDRQTIVIPKDAVISWSAPRSPGLPQLADGCPVLPVPETASQPASSPPPAATAGQTPAPAPTPGSLGGTPPR